MTIYDKGLIRAMKQAYKETGYIVAVTEDSVIIQTTFWGVEIVKNAVPNSIKGLIVVHNGEMPRPNTAVNIQKSECSSVILETALATMDELLKIYTDTGGVPIKPTRLTFDGMRVWQTTTDLKLRLVEADDQQILTGEHWEAHLVGRYIYGRNWFGSMYVLPQTGLPEDKPLRDHLSQMQWIPVELE